MLDKNFINNCKETLMKMKNEYSQVLKRPMSHEFKTSDTLDMATSERFLKDSVTFRKRMSDLLPRINAALMRIEHGTYGVCLVTGESINPNRLKAVPWTTMSLEGKNQYERGLGY